MRILLAAAFAAVLAISLSAAGLAGVWKGTVETQMGTMGITLTFRDGPGVTGEFASDMAEGKIEKGRLDGNKISFQVDVGHGVLSFEGTVAGDEMKLTLTGTSGNQYQLTCKKQK